MLSGDADYIKTAFRSCNMPIDIFDKFAKPPCAELLGWDLIDADIEAGWVRIGFEAKPQFCNPAGYVQGGMLAAMLDDTLGPAVFVKTRGALFTATIDLHVHYLAPARVGRLFGEAVVVQLGKSIGFVEGKLMDADGVIVATGTAAARLVETAKIIARASFDTAA
jgi:uncharacterized protein (TIGR00369 family)